MDVNFYLNVQKLRWRDIQYMKFRLLLLHHASKCLRVTGNCCETSHCAATKNLWKHIEHCKIVPCNELHCFSSRFALTHYHCCDSTCCAICEPLKKVTAEITSQKIVLGGTNLSSFDQTGPLDGLEGGLFSLQAAPAFLAWLTPEEKACIAPVQANICRRAMAEESSQKCDTLKGLIPGNMPNTHSVFAEHQQSETQQQQQQQLKYAAHVRHLLHFDEQSAQFHGEMVNNRNIKQRQIRETDEMEYVGEGIYHTNFSSKRLIVKYNAHNQNQLGHHSQLHVGTIQSLTSVEVDAITNENLQTSPQERLYGLQYLDSSVLVSAMNKQFYLVPHDCQAGFSGMVTPSRLGFGWQSRIDIRDRESIFFKVGSYLQQRRPEDDLLDKKWLMKLPQMTKRIEYTLCRNADSFQNYCDSNTLRSRLRYLVKELASITLQTKRQRQQNTIKLKDQVSITPGHGSAEFNTPSCLSVWQQQLVSFRPLVLQSQQTTQEQSLHTLTHSIDEISTNNTFGTEDRISDRIPMCGEEAPTTESSSFPSATQSADDLLDFEPMEICENIQHTSTSVMAGIMNWDSSQPFGHKFPWCHEESFRLVGNSPSHGDILRGLDILESVAPIESPEDLKVGTVLNSALIGIPSLSEEQLEALTPTQLNFLRDKSQAVFHAALVKFSMLTGGRRRRSNLSEMFIDARMKSSAQDAALQIDKLYGFVDDVCDCMQR